MGVTRAEIRGFIQKNRARILSFLDAFVAINSYSHDRAGVNAAGDLLVREMPGGFAHEVISHERYGNHHVLRRCGDCARPIVLAGHVDTLCPPDPAFCRLDVRGETLVGPGVNDMKGGDAVALWALKALEACGALDCVPVVCIFNGDEEVGSPSSHALFSAMRGKAAAALVFECGGPEGTVVTTRKGIARFRMTITGQASHFGNLRGRKISAVEELAHKVLSVESLNRPDRSLVANVGRVEGGLAANAVAEHACMDFELRYWDPALETVARERVESIVRESAVEGCAASLETLSGRPAMQPTEESRALFRQIVALGAELGQPIIEEKRGGVSDACWLSHAGIPTIDGLGPLGDHDFTPHEYIRTETLFDRIELTALLLLRLAKEEKIEE